MNLSRGVLEALLRNLKFYIRYQVLNISLQVQWSNNISFPLQGILSKKDAEEIKEMSMDDAEKESAWFLKCGYQDDYGSNYKTPLRVITLKHVR